MSLKLKTFFLKAFTQWLFGTQIIKSGQNWFRSDAQKRHTRRRLHSEYEEREKRLKWCQHMISDEELCGPVMGPPLLTKTRSEESWVEIEIVLQNQKTTQ